MSGFWSSQEVLLTGATGFLGSILARRMIDANAHVSVLTRDAARARDLEAEGATVVEGDITDPATFDIGTPDVVVHAAAWVAFGIPENKHELFWETNVEGTKHVLDEAKNADVARFCHISSVAAIGPTPSGLYPEERAVERRYPEFTSLYEEAKHAAHEHVLDNHGRMQTTLPMPSVVLGLDGDAGGLIRAHHAGKLWNVSGDNPTGFVHVEDVVDGILAAIQHGEGPYILNDENLVVDQLLDRFEQASGIPAPDHTIPLWVLKAAAGAIEPAYHLLGKVPPLSKSLLRSLELPMTYSSLRASEELGFEPDMVQNLEDDFAELEG
jgi:dihydroflavonol-4-reductase